MLKLRNALLSAAVVAGGVVAPAATPASAATTTTVTPIRVALPGIDRVTDVLGVGADVWTAAGDKVLITSPTGQVRKTVTGLPGATGLTAGPGGVYVSLSTAGRIVKLSPAGAVLASWTSMGCPGKSGVAQGGLFYAYGCDAAAAGVARLDLGTGVSRSVLTDRGASAVVAAGSTVVAYGSSSATSYAIGPDGSLTGRGQVSGTIYDAELSPDGTSLAVTDYVNGYGVARFDTATMTLTSTVATGPYPSAVAWSADGHRFAGVLSASSSDSPVHVFSTSTGGLLTRTPAAGGNTYRSAHEAAFSPDGKYVYSISQEPASPAHLVVTPTSGQVKQPFAVGVKRASAYGKSMTVTVRATNRPLTAVTVRVMAGGTTLARTVRTNASGVATWSLGARGSGTVTATAAASLTTQPASASAAFTTAGAASAKLTGYTRISKGVAHYRSLGAVHATLQILPRHAGRVTVSLQHRSGATWVTDQSATFATDAAGAAWVGLAQGNRKMTYRFVVGAAGDTAATASPKVTTASFVVD
ncbi:YncE family protein [Actinoplanes sp. M2I2]|uniref:YncE family protein n=1 Tax=Actinoplanes sp. M2I2 TaxID=1734444 RepID=UPI00202076A2|nr:WD40 repeat domain-containing protein [Actinoplanes sp. M2I2]